MTPEFREHARTLFRQAVEIPSADRATFLASACASDVTLREEVERLLAAHAEGRMPTSPAEMATADLARAPEGTASLGRPGVAPPTPSAARGLARTSTFAGGDVVGERYRIVRFIAEGGMGEVYEAEDLALHGRVALKTIRPEIAEDAQALERFKREIQVARKVTHPNVCRIYDLGTHRSSGDGPSRQILFLTMEMLSGETLAERISRAGRLTSAEALPLVVQIAAGLDSAHTAGIIHRDFKSANVILVGGPGAGIRAVVTDFGLARAAAADTSVMSVTELGGVVGTPAYMAPEQVQGKPATAAADLYALGIVIYEMVTGARPFGGGSAMTVAVKRLTEAPASPRSIVADLDPSWEAAILRCLERDPKDRFSDAKEVIQALTGSPRTPTEWRRLEAGPVAASGSRRPLSRDPRAVGVALILSVASAGLVWRSLSRSAGGTTAREVAPARPSVAVLGFRNASGKPEAEWLATAISEMLTTDLAAGGKVRVLPGEEIARIRRELDISDPGSAAVASLLKGKLGADVVASGSYTLLDGGLLRIDARLQNVGSTEVLAAGKATGTESQLFDLVSRAGSPLRGALGAGGVSPTEALQVEASLPGNAEAARLYSEGLARLRLFDAKAARDILQKAAAADPKHPLIHAALAASWSAIGFESAAREEARLAMTLSDALSDRQKRRIEARLHETEKDWGKAIEAYRALFESSPDDLDAGLDLAEAQARGGRSTEALVTLESLRRLPGALAADPRIDLVEALAHRELSAPHEQQRLAESAARKASALGARLLLARARALEATALQALGETGRAMTAFEAARELYEAGGDVGGLARTLNDMASALYSTGDLDGARRLFERAVVLHREIGDESGAARALHNLGNVSFDAGKLSEAEKLYDESLATFRRVGARYEEAVTLNDLGARLQYRGDLAAAGQRYREALTVFQQIGEKRGVATTLANLAELLFIRGDLRQAQDLQQESLALCREIGDKDVAAYDLYRLGELFSAAGDLHAARDRYEEALKMQQQIGDKMAQAQTRLGIAGIASAEGRSAEAESMLREAEESLRTGGAPDLASLAQAQLAEILLAQGRLDEARKAGDAVAKATAGSEDRHVRLAAAVAAARIRAAAGRAEDVAAALLALDRARKEAEKGGFVKDGYEAELAAGEIEIAAGKAGGRTRLQALARDAAAKGYGLVARRAEKALGPA